MKERTLLERRARTAARAALYGSLGVVGVVLAAVLLYMQSLQPEEVRFDWKGVDFAAMPEVELFQRYVQIDTCSPTGNELAGARFLAARAREGRHPVDHRGARRHATPISMPCSRARAARRWCCTTTSTPIRS